MAYLSLATTVPNLPATSIGCSPLASQVERMELDSHCKQHNMTQWAAAAWIHRQIAPFCWGPTFFSPKMNAKNETILGYLVQLPCKQLTYLKVDYHLFRWWKWQNKSCSVGANPFCFPPNYGWEAQNNAGIRKPFIRYVVRKQRCLLACKEHIHIFTFANCG